MLQAHMAGGDGEKGIEVVNQQDAGMTTALELAVRFGRTLVVAEVDTITPVRARHSFCSLARLSLRFHGAGFVGFLCRPCRGRAASRTHSLGAFLSVSDRFCRDRRSSSRCSGRTWRGRARGGLCRCANPLPSARVEWPSLIGPH